MSENIFQQPQQLQEQQTQQQMSNVSKQSGFEVPIEAIPLPSKGLLYPPGHPLHNEQFVEIKAMTAKEEDLMTSKALMKKGRVLDELLKSCLINKMINIDDLLEQDKNALLIRYKNHWLWSTT